jgi:hypothetical protein
VNPSNLTGVLVLRSVVNASRSVRSAFLPQNADYAREVEANDATDILVYERKPFFLEAKVKHYHGGVLSWI